MPLVSKKNPVFSMASTVVSPQESPASASSVQQPLAGSEVAAAPVGISTASTSKKSHEKSKQDTKSKTKTEKKLAFQKAKTLKQQEQMIQQLESIMANHSSSSSSEEEEDPPKSKRQKQKDKKWEQIMMNQQKNLDLLTDLYASQWYGYQDNYDEDDGDRRSRLASDKGEQMCQRQFVDVMRRQSLFPKRKRHYSRHAPYP